MKKFSKILITVFWLFLFLSGANGCGRDSAPAVRDSDSAAADPLAYKNGAVRVKIPESPGIVTAGTDLLVLDLSYTDQGYFTAALSDENTKINLQVTGPDDVVYKYFLSTSGSAEVFPFTAGSGTYTIMVYENIGEDRYAALFAHMLEVELENEFLPFLYPNQYVAFTPDSEAITLAASLCENVETDLDALDAVYHYVISNITYDTEKAQTVQSGYLPDIDETLKTGTGICFDYAAVMTAMLRSLSIPTRLSIGYHGDVRHAWIDVYIQSIGWVKNAVEFNGEEWKLMDPTLASALDGENVSAFIGDGSTYSELYVR